MTCPAITVADFDAPFSFTNCQLRYISEKVPKDGLPNIVGKRLEEYTSNEQRFDIISEWVLDCIQQTTKNEKCDAIGVFIEDYSFGSKGKVFHIAENTGLLKHKLWRLGFPITTVPPTVIKKFAQGKGNATKEMMHDAFVKETRTPLMPIFQPKAESVGSPTGDLVDSFFICKYGYYEGSLRLNTSKD